MTRPTWFRCDAGKLLGALAGMKPDPGYLYTIILMRIYEVSGPIADDEVMLSRRTGLNAKRVASALAWLIEHGKVERLSDGRLDSKTTHAEISHREATISHKVSSGKSSAKKRATKNQSLQQNEAATVQRPSIRARVLDTDIDSVATATGAEAPKAPEYPTEITERLWAEGVVCLTAMGAADRDARSNIGRWLKAGHAPGHVLDAILRAREHGTKDPVPLVSRLLSPGKPNGKQSVQAAARSLVERNVDFGPVPKPYMPSGGGDEKVGNPARLLPQGGRGGARDLRDSSGGSPRQLSAGGGVSGDGSSLGPSGEKPVASDRG